MYGWKMQRWLMVTAACTQIWAWSPATAADAALEPFFGSWACTRVSVAGAPATLDVRADDLDVAIQRDGDGFRVRWTDFERTADRSYARRVVDARFTPTARTGVYAYDEDEPSLLGRLFAAPATGNPLEGDTLLWARVDGPTLTVYSLALTEEGGFDLDKYARSVTEDTMQLVHTRRSEDPPQLVVRGQLEPSGD